MYLTQIYLTRQNMLQNKLYDVYSFHKLVYSFFPYTENKERFLYVNKGIINDSYHQLLILSKILPNIPDDIASTSIKISDNFFNFKSYRFEIILNPVKTDIKTKKRVSIINKDDLTTWFLNKINKLGFTVSSLTITNLKPITFVKNHHKCVFNHVKFSGHLNVTDKNKFIETFKSGIGHGKAFGFGLIQLIPN